MRPGRAPDREAASGARTHRDLLPDSHCQAPSCCAVSARVTRGGVASRIRVLTRRTNVNRSRWRTQRSLVVRQLCVGAVRTTASSARVYCTTVHVRKQTRGRGRQFRFPSRSSSASSVTSRMWAATSVARNRAQQVTSMQPHSLACRLGARNCFVVVISH